MEATTDRSEPATIGAALRHAREAADLTLADVAERTKIRPGILTAIEADDHASLPALTYSLGFVKAFARTVGLDPADAADRYRRETDKTPPAPTLIAVTPLDEKRLPSARLVLFATMAAVLLVGLVWAWGAGWFDGPTPADPAAPVAVAALPAAQAAAPPAQAAVPTPAPEGPVVLTAAEDAWLRVYDRLSGKAVYEGVLAKGQSFPVPPPQGGWLLRTGRAGAVQVRVGDRVIPSLGGPVEVIKHVSLAPADLLARAGAPMQPAIQTQAAVQPAATATAPSSPAQ